MDQYFKPIPELSFYDVGAIRSISEERKDEFENYISPGHGHIVESTTLKLNYQNYTCLTEIYNTMDLSCKKFFKFVWFRPQFQLWAHLDENRGCAIIFPINPIPPQPFFWEKDGQKVVEYTFSCPTLINVQEYHSFYASDSERLTLQLSIYDDYENVLQRYLNNDLIAK